MKIRRLIYLLPGLMLMLMSACNSDSSTVMVGEYNTGSSVMVTEFSLVKNDSVLANLDSVYFSINLDEGRIFNADSLPVGTKITSLQVNIKLPTCRVASLREYGAASTDSIDYLTSSTDSIDFSKGPVTLHIVSADGEVERNYTIEVNVHKVDPNDMSWIETAQGELPTTLSAVTDLGCVENDGRVVCFTTDGTDYCRAESSDPYSGSWSTEGVSMPAGARLGSLVNEGADFYVLDSAGQLYASSDEGVTWTSTGVEMSHVYGVSGGKVLGVRASGDQYVHCTYPETTEVAVAEDCPVAGTSQLITYVTEWSTEPLTVFCGGTTAGGDVTGSTWAYDGEEWAEISTTPIPDITGMTLVPYFAFRVNNAWKVSESSIILAFGGVKSNGEMNKTSYVSYNRGVDWEESSQYLTLPDEITPAYERRAFVVPQTFSSRSAAGWTSLPQRRIPHWLCYEVSSRAVKPITEWDCPFIYLFGGFDEQGAVVDKIWRGAINRLIFKPLQ